MSSSHENLPPQVMRKLMRQIKKLSRSPPDGVTYIPRDDDNISEIYAEIDGPADTPYAGGKFTVKLVVGREFPQAPPKGYFLTKIYHPNVAPSGDICVNTLKRDWSPDLGLGHVLKVIWCLLLVPFPESSLNDEAGKLFMESYDEYSKKAALMTSIYAMPKKMEASAAVSSRKSADTVDAHFPAKKAKVQRKTSVKSAAKKENKKRQKTKRQKSLKRL